MRRGRSIKHVKVGPFQRRSVPEPCAARRVGPISASHCTSVLRGELSRQRSFTLIFVASSNTNAHDTLTLAAQIAAECASCPVCAAQVPRERACTRPPSPSSTITSSAPSPGWTRLACSILRVHVLPCYPHQSYNSCWALIESRPLKLASHPLDSKCSRISAWLGREGRVHRGWQQARKSGCTCRPLPTSPD